jgi:ABC-type antimicrobial peptide transport system permease subunit
VVNDFHTSSLYDHIEPTFIQAYRMGAKTLVKMHSGNTQETINQLTNVFEEFNSGLPFEFDFVDKDYDAMYQSEKRISKLSQYAAIVAIIISCLGLFGLSTFTTERRLKEIGIRKILGSSVFGLVKLLTIDFSKMVVLSILIALPVGYLITSNWLNEFVYRTELDWTMYGFAGCFALAIAWLTVGLQTHSSARVNPVECLKDE